MRLHTLQQFQRYWRAMQQSAKAIDGILSEEIEYLRQETERQQRTGQDYERQVKELETSQREKVSVNDYLRQGGQSTRSW